MDNSCNRNKAIAQSKLRLRKKSNRLVTIVINPRKMMIRFKISYKSMIMVTERKLLSSLSMTHALARKD